MMMEKILLLLLSACVIIGMFSYTILALTGFKSRSMVTELMMMMYSFGCIGFTLIGGKLLYNIVPIPMDNPAIMIISYIGAGVIYILVTRLIGTALNTALKRNLPHYQVE